MKLLYTFIITVFLFQDSKNISEELLGSWKVSDSESPDTPHGIWEFNKKGGYESFLIKKIGEFRTGEFKTDHLKDTIVPNRNGNWKLDNDTLIIMLTSEFENGKEVFYKLIGTMKFLPNKQDNGLSLTPILYGEKQKIKLFLKR